MAALTVALLAVAYLERGNPLVAPFLSFNFSSRNGAAVDDEAVGGEDIPAVE